jgi:hypothetical protein
MASKKKVSDPRRPKKMIMLIIIVIHNVDIKQTEKEREKLFSKKFNKSHLAMVLCPYF